MNGAVDGLVGLLARRGLETPAGIAWMHRVFARWRPVTWRDYAGLVAASQSALIAAGVRARDDVVVVIRQDPQFLAAYLGVRAADARPVVTEFDRIADAMSTLDGDRRWVLVPGVGRAESPAGLPPEVQVILLRSADDSGPGPSWESARHSFWTIEPGELDEWLANAAAGVSAPPVIAEPGPVALFGAPDDAAMLAVLTEKHVAEGNPAFLTRSRADAMRDLPVLRPRRLTTDAPTAHRIANEVRSRLIPGAPPIFAAGWLLMALSIVCAVIASLVGEESGAVGAVLCGLVPPLLLAAWPTAGAPGDEGSEADATKRSRHRLLLGLLAVLGLLAWLFLGHWPLPRKVFVIEGLSMLILLVAGPMKLRGIRLGQFALRRAFGPDLSVSGEVPSVAAQRGGALAAMVCILAGVGAMLALRGLGDWPRLGLLVLGLVLAGAFAMATGSAVRGRVRRMFGFDRVASLHVVGQVADEDARVLRALSPETAPGGARTQRGTQRSHEVQEAVR